VALYFCSYFRQLLTIFTIFHWHTLWTICNNVIIVYHQNKVPHPHTVHPHVALQCSSFDASRYFLMQN